MADYAPRVVRALAASCLLLSAGCATGPAPGVVATPSASPITATAIPPAPAPAPSAQRRAFDVGAAGEDPEPARPPLSYPDREPQAGAPPAPADGVPIAGPTPPVEPAATATATPAATSTPAPAPTPTPSPTPTPTQQFASNARELLLTAAINGERAAVGQAALTHDPGLSTVAKVRSLDMATNDYFGHVSPSGGTVVDLLIAFEVPFGALGENLANVSGDVERSVAIAMEALMASAVHRDNILGGAYTRVGVGVAVTAEGAVIITMLFSDG